MATIHCLGAGLVGSFVAKKLAVIGHDVHVHDVDPWRVADFQRITVHEGDAIESCMQLSSFGEFDIVANMLPGDIGEKVIEMLCQMPYKIVDLSFSRQTPDVHAKKAADSGCSILWDVGIAPGLSNMLLAEAHKQFGDLRKGVVKVGGNPTTPTGDWSYMAPFSPKDVIAEYTRPARVIRESEEVTLPALSENHVIEVPGKGEMEAFLTDGLRSVLGSIPAIELSEYTIRWPGHIQKFIDERDSGVLDDDSLAAEWQYDSNVPEFTWMEVLSEGRDGRSMTWRVQDHGSEDGHSMARCTGLVTLCCIEEWLSDPEMLPAGVHAPEVLASDVVSRIISRMSDEGIEVVGPIFS
ncbi:MAG: saccharopine dehydrogenase C-terminal domain-containing protein [Candidatus Thalassarchaeaceae archaeon]|jgi:saccharopine dehydrogenase-like NADP-dependent oxidoreductase|nr:saccharopine dehydrogenase C-terminal domain-containing protein [Candidatus Thalassarchaeaceae archaeon]